MSVGGVVNMSVAGVRVVEFGTKSYVLFRQVAVGDVVVRSYTPARTGQRTTIIHIYCSERPDPSFVTDVGVRRCGTLCLDLTDVLYHHSDTSAAAEGSGSESGLLGRRTARGRREIRTRMTFGDTEIRVDAVDMTTGRCVRAGIDFLNKWSNVTTAPSVRGFISQPQWRGWSGDVTVHMGVVGYRCHCQTAAS